MSLYVFAIGGSGSRVLRSLTMLLASSVTIEDKVVPVIIDPDNQNGDLNRTKSELDLYCSIRSQLTFNDKSANKFFGTHIESLNGDGNYLMPLVGTSGTAFSKYINIGCMSNSNQAMMRMLFSDDNLGSKMDVGFKGNPNIGSVVLNQFTQSDAFKAFENKFVAGDKVFIISSIFGGTGASGFPLLLKTLRTSNNKALQSAQIGALSLLPYFNLQNNDESKIEADSFVTKMKAALNYYESNVTGNGTLDEMYYLGDTLSSKPYDNCDGGDLQKNDTHVIEMLGGLAIVDFATRQVRPSTDGVHQTSFHEFGLLNDVTNREITFNDFSEVTRTLIERPLSQLALINSYFTNRSKSDIESQFWLTELDNLQGSKFLQSGFYTNFQQFMNGVSGGDSGYSSWLNQMASNEASFKPFLDDSVLKEDDVLKKVVGHEPHYGFGFFSKKSYNLLDTTLSEKCKDMTVKNNAPSVFMELFYTTTKEILKDKLSIN